MAKDEIDRASRAGVEEVAVASKQHDAAELLKKMKVVADADEHQAPAEAAQAEAPAPEASPEAQMVASADSIFASDASSTMVAAADTTATDAGSSGGVSTGTLLAIGGVALVGGGIAIAANSDGGGHKKSETVTSVTAPSGAVTEGDTVTFTVEGTPGASFGYTYSGVENGSGSVTIGPDGIGYITVPTTADSVADSGALTVTVGGQSASVTVNDPPAQNMDLTTGTDTPPDFDFTGTSGANHISGVASGNTILVPGTFTVGDHIIGNGETVLDLKVGLGGAEALVSLENLGSIDLINAAGATTAAFNATLWSGVGAINLVDGADGLAAFFTDLEVGVDMSIASGVAGTLVAEFTNDVVAGIGADHNSTISWIDNNVDASVAIGETAGFGLGYMNPNPLDITVGNISADVAKLGEFDVSIDDAGGPGALTVGDISVTGGISSDVYVSISATGPVAGFTHDLTVGNISVALDLSSSVEVSISNEGYNTVGDTVVGDVALSVGSGTNATADFEVYNYAYESHVSDAVSTGSITVGNIAMTAGDSGYAVVDVGNYADASSGSATAGDVTVGNVSMSVGDSATAYFYVSDTADVNAGSGSATAGNVTVGDITLAGGDDAYIYAYGAYHTAEASGSGDATVGDTTIGMVDVSVGDTATAYFYVENSAYANSGDATVGNTTIGGLSLSGGFSSTIEASITATAYAGGGGAAAVGDMAIGDIDISIGQSGFASLTVEQYAYAASGAASVGDTTIGNMTLDVATSATIEVSISLSAYANSSNDATIGNVVMGDLSVTENVNATVDYELTVEATASGSGVATIGDVTVGAIGATLNDGATFDYYMYVYAADSTSSSSIGVVSVGDISLLSTNGVSSYADVDLNVQAAAGTVGGFSIGNIDAVLGASATAYVSADVTAASIGDVSVGDVSVVAGTGYFYGYVSLSSTNGDIGAITVGDVTLNTTGDGTAYYYVFADANGGNVGDITVGDISINSHGTSAYGSFELTVDANATGDIGNITLGNVVMDVTGPSAEAYLYVSASSAASVGTLTVGSLDLSVNANTDDATTQTATVDVYLYNDGDIVVGDISFDVGEAQGANPVTDFNNFSVSISATGDVTLGVISVTGGDGVQDAINGAAFDDFANVMAAVTSGGDITIGGVDYSGYGAAAVIDVSTYLGAATIVGSAFGDTITDNDGTNTITGGAGADTFAFLDTNTGKTEAAADKITDFVYGTDHIDLTPAINVGNYSEGTYADFASFLSGADGADKAVLAGQVGDNVFLAVDYNTDNTVDYVIELTNTTLANVAVDSFV